MRTNYITISKDIEVDIDLDDVFDELTDDEIIELAKDRGIDFINSSIDNGDDNGDIINFSNSLIEFLKLRYKIYNQTDVLNAIKELLSMSTLPK